MDRSAEPHARFAIIAGWAALYLSLAILWPHTALARDIRTLALDAIEADPGLEITIDVETRRVRRIGGGAGRWAAGRRVCWEERARTGATLPRRAGAATEARRVPGAGLRRGPEGRPGGTGVTASRLRWARGCCAGARSRWSSCGGPSSG